ncbi:MAG: XRE family transcriptional regulator [Bacteroidetes bacterium]|nr:MAG: XRE family transcriptional regulator [Bacteroidota bacterium]
MVLKMNKIKFIIEKTKTGFSAYSQDYAIATTGLDIEELKSNIVEASNLYFESLSKYISEQDIILESDYKQMFAFYDFLNAKGFAKSIGMNQSLLSQYISGIKELSPKQKNKIGLGLKKISSELQQIAFF